MNFSKLDEYIEQGYIKQQKHPETDLFIYNYTAQTQYSKFWDDLTLACRGLILDKDRNIIARPFCKFFNYEEHKDIPSEPFETTKKMDGSLGILYWINNTPYIATRGSFTSPQALKASEMLRTTYGHTWDKLREYKQFTFLFEILYPANRIVVDYGDRQELVLLSVIHTESGQESWNPKTDLGFPRVEPLTPTTPINPSDLLTLDIPNEEGFVIRFKNSGLRVKIKFAEYKRLHRIVTGVSSKTVWEYLFLKKDFQELIDRVPDEFYTWVINTKRDLQAQYNDILYSCNAFFKLLNKEKSRKELAEIIKMFKYSHVIFRMLDKKDYETLIWREVEPKFEQPFKKQNEDIS